MSVIERTFGFLWWESKKESNNIEHEYDYYQYPSLAATGRSTDNLPRLN